MKQSSTHFAEPVALARRTRFPWGRRLQQIALPVCLSLAVLGLATAREAAPTPVDAAYQVDARGGGPAMSVDFIGNASRLDTLLGLRSAAALADWRAKPGSAPSAEFFRSRYPHYRQFRVGNLFVGWQCTSSDFDELVTRGPDGRPQYHFDQTLDMLQWVVAAGIKPHLALTGTPRALVPDGEPLLKHPNYGCVNAAALDLRPATPRERMPDWWALQDAFLTAAVARFGQAEVRSWSFATWTEPLNPTRKLAHLVLPKDIVQSGRHDEGVATVIAASIDVAMKHGVRIRLGNMAGPVQAAYPKLIALIARFPRGNEYVSYIDGYAISRYRIQGGADIGRNIDAAFALLADPAMPAKPIYIDEVGDLAGLDGAEPFAGASGLEGARFMAGVLERVYARQDGSARVPRSVALWRDQIEPRARNIFTQPQAYLKTPASHVTDFFVSLNGHERLAVQGPAHQIIAGRREASVKVLLLPGAAPARGAVATPQTRALSVRGLRPQTDYEVRLTEIGREHGNPISVFLEGAAGYLQDDKGRFRSDGGKWALATPQWEACYFDENSSCAWRQKARDRESPLVRGSRIRSDASGALSTSMVTDEAAIVMVDLSPAR